MLRNTWRRARPGLAQHVAAANAHAKESTYAQLVDMMSMIVTHNRLRDGSLEIWVENATCAQRMDRAKLNSWRVNLASSGGSARFLAFTR